MTESERALITLRNALECATDDVTREDLEFSIQAIEKIEALEKNKTYLLYREYLSIGTIEEFKALKEKAEPKKVANQGCYDKNGVLHIWNGINGVPYDLCPSCEINLCTDGRFGRKKMNYCENCGQRLDWD